jgi:hypothetical protein
MSVSASCSQRWRLRRMDRWISRSDPHLAAMLAIFARLSAGEAIASIEQAGFRHTRAWGNLIRMGQAARLLLAHAGRAFRWARTAVTRPRPGREHARLGLGAGQGRPRADEKYG